MSRGRVFAIFFMIIGVALITYDVAGLGIQPSDILDVVGLFLIFASFIYLTGGKSS